MDRADLVDRLYRAGGPKHGLRQRQDAIDTLWRGYTYLRLRAQLEGSGDFATTAEQTIVGLSFELSRRGAKAWDPAIGSGLRGKARREELLRRRGSALTKLLNELAGAGVLVGEESATTSVNLIGRLTRDPELVESKGGTSIVNFALALDRRERDQDPVYVEVKAFAGQADAIAEHKRKGDEVAVEGRLELDRWEAKDGSNRSRLYVVANRVQFLRNKRSEHNGADPAAAEAASEDIPA